MPNAVFDSLFVTGARAVLEGRHRRDTVPEEGGRWPVSLIHRPAIAEQVHTVTEALIPYAGHGHFRTGDADAVHCTVRALEPRHEAAAADDPITALWCGAIDRVAEQARPFDLIWTGLTLTPVGVLAQLETPDGAGWDFLDLVRAELGPYSWYEERSWQRRNIWYATLVHFAGPIADPAGLVDQVRRLRTMPPVTFSLDHLTLSRFDHSPQHQAMVPTAFHRWDLRPWTGERFG